MFLLKWTDPPKIIPIGEVACNLLSSSLGNHTEVNSIYLRVGNYKIMLLDTGKKQEDLYMLRNITYFIFMTSLWFGLFVCFLNATFLFISVVAYQLF